MREGRSSRRFGGGVGGGVGDGVGGGVGGGGRQHNQRSQQGQYDQQGHHGQHGQQQQQQQSWAHSQAVELLNNAKLATDAATATAHLKALQELVLRKDPSLLQVFLQPLLELQVSCHNSKP
jgi:hypothetical protein